MHLKYILKKIASLLLPIVLSLSMISHVYAAGKNTHDDVMTMDKIQLVSKQIELLKDRSTQDQQELSDLQKNHDHELAALTIDKINKSLLVKSSLDIATSQSNLESINIELTDSEQAEGWLEKNIQEIQSQLSVLNIFGLKFTNNVVVNVKELQADLTYQQKLLTLEKIRIGLLQHLQKVADNILQLKREDYNRFAALLKSHNLMTIKQQQVKDELSYQEQQNYWLNQVNFLSTKLEQNNTSTTKNAKKEKKSYVALERDIFYANENANFSYLQSLLARYKNQLQQMKLSVSKSNSIGLLDDVSDQIQTLTKQINRLQQVSTSRVMVLEKHISYLNKKTDSDTKSYVNKLIWLDNNYNRLNKTTVGLNNNLFLFRTMLDSALQKELAARQGITTFNVNTLLDLGKELLLFPALIFQVIKSLSVYSIDYFYHASIAQFSLLALAEGILLCVFFGIRKMLLRILLRHSLNADQDIINAKWLSLQWLRRNFVELAVFSNILAFLGVLAIPSANYIFIVYLALVWFIFKSILIVARVWLLETNLNEFPNNLKLYRRLKRIILIGGTITAVCVFVHQLPMIYVIKTLCDSLFLLFLLFMSLLLLRSCKTLPAFISSRITYQHPYLQKSIKVMGFLIPILMLANSLIGLFGFMNLILTVAWYEAIFLMVLLSYLILRCVLIDLMDQCSRLIIHYMHHGWLWTEAFVKPIDKILRVTLFFIAGVVLFLLYGWDKQSPIVERLTRLIHYPLINMFNNFITPINIIELVIVIYIFYWTAKWTREFVYQMLLSRTKDLGIRNTIAILSQYTVVVIGILVCLRVLGIDFGTLKVVAGAFTLGIGLGLRDLANNFASGFLILLERPIRVGDIVNINNIEGEVIHIGGRAVTVRTWDHMEYVVPNTEIFNKSFTNWTAHDNIVRSVVHVKISRYDNPHEVQKIIEDVLLNHGEILHEPHPEIYLKDLSDTIMDFEFRFFVNIRAVHSRTSVVSAILMKLWDAFAAHGIKPPYPQQEIFLRSSEAEPKREALEFLPHKKKG